MMKHVEPANLAQEIPLDSTGRYILRYNDTMQLYLAWITIYSTTVQYQLEGNPYARLVEKCEFLHLFTPIEFLADGNPPDLEEME